MLDKSFTFSTHVYIKFSNHNFVLADSNFEVYGFWGERLVSLDGPGGPKEEWVNLIGNDNIKYCTFNKYCGQREEENSGIVGSRGDKRTRKCAKNNRRVGGPVPGPIWLFHEKSHLMLRNLTSLRRTSYIGRGGNVLSVSPSPVKEHGAVEVNLLFDINGWKH